MILRSRSHRDTTSRPCPILSSFGFISLDWETNEDGLCCLGDGISMMFPVLIPLKFMEVWSCLPKEVSVNDERFELGNRDSTNFTFTKRT